VPQGALFLLLPGLGIPAALVFGALDEVDVFVAIEQRHAAFDQTLVVLRPVAGQLGHGRRAVAFEPGGFEVAGSHLARHDNLEGALARVNGGWFEPVPTGVMVAEILVGNAVEDIAAPVEFLLQDDHTAKQSCSSVFMGIEGFTG
jgi:hypothetical protein